MMKSDLDILNTDKKATNIDPHLMLVLIVRVQSVKYEGPLIKRFNSKLLAKHVIYL